ncbi:MAG TPA: hypothetical protein VFC07_15775, partial [Verrucomicrobiae bacterium]|nr:hypothetical protein [Verrucomicrobiae bacterium]
MIKPFAAGRRQLIFASRFLRARENWGVAAPPPAINRMELSNTVCHQYVIEYGTGGFFGYFERSKNLILQ